ncbi:MAG: hypothetical protein Ct9H300mP5_2520 [Candidatus Pelagibacterales bacterium]|nr:MAG: hypothetical protein Ct9H300mP5_2520 [Pelagibacterales bacterium]
MKIKYPFHAFSCWSYKSYLIKMKLRAYVSLNIQTGEALDTHSYATLLGAGATTINPYLGFRHNTSKI